VATSGNYEQYYTIEDQQWSHIIDPRSGYPQIEVISSTVIAPNAMEADALATALCVLGSGPGTEIMDSFSDKHASMIIVKNKSGRLERFRNKTYDLYKSGSWFK
jgi:thiamine biosynthesis lipoprotein